MEDRELKCKDCGAMFIFTGRDQEFYKERDYSEPKRCKNCRVIKKDRFDSYEQKKQKTTEEENDDGFSKGY